MQIRENDGLEVVTDLRLTLPPSNDEVGAGANAASRTDMIFVTNDSLSELVWSPHRGLSIRCAVRTVTDQKTAAFSCDHTVLSPPNTMSSPTASKDDANEAIVNMPDVQPGQHCESGSPDSINNSSPINNVQDDATNAAIEATGLNSPGIQPRSILPESVGDKLECVAENELLNSDNVMPSSAGETRADQYQLDVCEIRKASPIRALATETKGIEKAMSDNDLKKEASQEDDDDSCDSVESCNSAKQFSARKKRVLSFKEQLIVGSKRVKMQINEAPGSSSFTRPNSSFSNWISAMVRGLSRPDEESPSPSTAQTSTEHETKADKFDHMGFQSLFQSLYRPNPKVQDQKLLCNDSQVKDNTSKSLSQSLAGSTQDPLLHSKALKGKTACDPLDSQTDASSKRFCLNPDSKKDDHLSSLFITHFCPKSSKAAANSAQHKQVPAGMIECAAGSSGLLHKPHCNIDLHGRSSEEPSDSSSIKKLHNTVKEVEAQNINQIVHFQRFQSSEAMVSVFAKRLDALKNILPADLTEKSGSSGMTCFFCGVVGHDLRYCPQVAENEVDGLLRNMAAYGGKEESPCLCIRCYQLNHWAAACPNAPSQHKNKADCSSPEIWHKKGLVRHLSLPDGVDAKTQPGLINTMNLDVKNAAFIEKASSDLQKANAARSQENASEFSGFCYPCGSLSMTKGIFDAVRSLQLSRTDIMKWMNSIYSTSLDGYYLRLRRKLGSGLGGTQYHVACICGTQEGSSAETSKRPISVIIGGIRCSVESQYISNQDFLEDELKAWWSATLSGDHRNIPSEDELVSKVEERKRLGL